jgi:cytochrome c oxidase assembly protein subunit 15
MPRTQNRAVLAWIIAFGSLAIVLVVYGGFVRLTRSGLSIVEWNPVMGAVPPMTQQAWQAEFAKYQLTPEYQHINMGMTVGQYKEIFLIEWLHRIIARIAGFVFAIPFVVFAWKRMIPIREISLYVLMGMLFLAQATVGWVMVASGLVDRPAVSHFLLTAHLFLALALVGISLWTALGHAYGFPDYRHPPKWSLASTATTVGFLVLLVQMAYGGLTAGLKAGHVAETWPLMLGRLVPRGMLNQIRPPLLNLVAAPLAVAFIHRWLAFAVLIGALLAAWGISGLYATPDLKFGIRLILLMTAAQIALGIAVVLSDVQMALALLHQLNAVGLFAAFVYLLHRLRARDRVQAR